MTRGDDEVHQIGARKSIADEAREAHLHKLEHANDEPEEEEVGGFCKCLRRNENGSVWQRMSQHAYFESTTMLVIVFNAFWIGIDTEWNHMTLADEETGKLPLEPVSTGVENFFCVYFTVEVFIRYLSFDIKKKCVFDAWFVFDSILVACMILETWVMVIVASLMNADSSGGVGPLSALRLLRLLRLARVGRLMKFVPEMAKLVKGMIKAARSVIFILIFLVLVMYVFAIIFTGTFSDREVYPLTPYCDDEIAAGLNETDDCLEEGEFGELGQDLFATMGDSFMSLFTRGVLGDNLDETVQAIMDQSLLLMWVFFVFLIITFATLLNMLIGVVCEVISDAAAEEEEQESADLLKNTITDAFQEIDSNDDGLVCETEWMRISENPKVRETMEGLGIEPERMEERLEQMSLMLFADPEEGLVQAPEEEPEDADQEDRSGLTVEQLIERLNDMRPDQDANALDLELMKAQVTKDQKLFKSKLKKVKKGLTKFLQQQKEKEEEKIRRREQLLAKACRGKNQGGNGPE